MKEATEAAPSSKCAFFSKVYREWLQDVYIEGGKFSAYLKGKVSRGELAPSVAQLVDQI